MTTKQANELSSGWLLNRFSLKYGYAAFMDTRDYLADQLFIKHQVPVKFMEEYAKPDSKYLMIFCRFPKRKEDAFCAALNELPNKMILLGNTDYQEQWDQLNNRKMQQKGEN